VGIHLGLVYHFVGFIPGIKAFTAAVLGGIGSVPGAMLVACSSVWLNRLDPPFWGSVSNLKT